MIQLDECQKAILYHAARQSLLCTVIVLACCIVYELIQTGSNALGSDVYLIFLGGVLVNTISVVLQKRRYAVDSCQRDEAGVFVTRRIALTSMVFFLLATVFAWIKEAILQESLWLTSLVLVTIFFSFLFFLLIDAKATGYFDHEK